MTKDYKPVKYLKGFPIEILIKIEEQQLNQGNNADYTVIDNDYMASNSNGGFDWDDTTYGSEFWGNVLEYHDFELFFNKYPKVDNKINTNIMIKDYKPVKDLKGFPIEILMKIEEEQVNQGNEPNYTILDNDFSTNSLNGGFTWGNSKEGYNFWENIICGYNFDLFFNKYPKKSEETSTTNTISNNLIEETFNQQDNKLLLL